MQTIVPHLWYDSDAETAARRYAELIPGSEIGAIVRYPRRAARSMAASRAR
jgi:predicted 3-demethylubiquinone-9 3-methyltransferase (glyoxalase superfamily)